MTTGHLDLFICSSPLEVVTAHVIARHYTTAETTTKVLAVEGEPDPRIVDSALWTEVVVLHDSRLVLPQWRQRFADNLAAVRAVKRRHAAQTGTLLVSNLYWLMNNALVADTVAAKSSGADFDLALFDQGLVMYCQARLGLPELAEIPRAIAKYALLRANGFPAMLITPWNADLRHPLPRRVFCWHPALLAPSKRLVPLDHGHVASYAARQLPALPLLTRDACLYLSQPIYRFIGRDTFKPFVERLRDTLIARGFSELYYKPHHHDDDEWRRFLEDELSFRALSGYDRLPAELLAIAIRPPLVAGHTSSALMNIAEWLDDVHVLAFGAGAIDKLGRFSAHPPIYPSVPSLFAKFPNIEIVG